MVERDIVERLCRYDGLGVVLVPVEVLRAAEAEIRRLRSAAPSGDAAAPSDRDVVIEECAKIVEDHYWDGRADGAVRRLYLSKMIRQLKTASSTGGE